MKLSKFKIKFQKLDVNCSLLAINALRHYLIINKTKTTLH
jgi:hypothetical protein